MIGFTFRDSLRAPGYARGLASVMVLAALSAACKTAPPELNQPLSETFDRVELGPGWLDTGGGYRIVDGALHVKGAHNHPLWLRQRLPRNVKIEFDATSRSPSGDIKVELHGDGESFDPDRGGYVATGYVLIFGGWGNSLSVICRQNEHDEGVKARRADRRVVPGQRYRFTIVHKDGRIDWSIDGEPFLSWTDPTPLHGAANQYFAFNNWEADVSFDNLRVEPL